MEIYINHRSLPLYQDLELNWQAKINAALTFADAKAADVLPLANSLLAQWDAAIRLVESGPCASPCPSQPHRPKASPSVRQAPSQGQRPPPSSNPDPPKPSPRPTRPLP